MAKTKLPPLPDTKPSGSMAEYLKRVRESKSPLDSALPDQSSHTSLIEAPAGLSFDENGPNGDKTREVETTLLEETNAGLSKILDKESENGPDLHVEKIGYTIPPNEPPAVEMSKILDKTQTNIPLSKLEQPFGDQPQVSRLQADQTQLVKKRVQGTVRKGGNTQSPEGLLNCLNELPLVFTSTFQKGEMKLRVTEDMAYFLRLLVDCCPQTQGMRYLPDNLVNDLLSQFFRQYGPEIAALRLETERDFLVQQNQRWAKLKAL